MEKIKNGEYVGIGKVMVTKSPVILFTILGSCLAVTLYNREMKIGGMAHILMAGDGSEDTKYVKPAIDHMIKKLEALGGRDLSWVAKITGGSTMNEGSNMLVANVGRYTALQALELLFEKQLNIVGMHVGGDCRRGVYFHLDTGEIKLDIEGSGIFDNEMIRI